MVHRYLVCFDSLISSHDQIDTFDKLDLFSNRKLLQYAPHCHKEVSSCFVFEVAVKISVKNKKKGKGLNIESVDLYLKTTLQASQIEAFGM